MEVFALTPMAFRAETKEQIGGINMNEFIDTAVIRGMASCASIP